MKTATRKKIKLSPKRGKHKGLNGASKVGKIRSLASSLRRFVTPPSVPVVPVVIEKPTISPAELAARLVKKKSMLQCRRWAIVLDEVIAAIMASTFKDVTVDLVDLVVLFGTHHRRVPAQGWREDVKRGALWKWFDNRKKEGYPCEREVVARKYGFDQTVTKLVPEMSRDEALWESLKPVLCDQLRGFRLVSELVPEGVDEDIRRVGAIIGFPVEARKNMADFTIKIPKSWGRGLDAHTLELPLAA